jgi:hypothetical protein
MNKDIFIEKLVSQKNSVLENILKIMIVISTIVIVLIINVVALIYLYQVFSFTLIISAALIYLAYRLVISIKSEFEYSLTNDELTVERIIAKRKRKSIFVGSCKDFSVICPIADPDYMNIIKKAGAIYDYSSGRGVDPVWLFMISQNGINKLVLFDYDDRFIDVFKRYNPRCFRK